jgi:hypothetical protein
MAKEKMDALKEEINDFYDSVRSSENALSDLFPQGRNKFHLSDEEIKQLNRLNQRKKQLASTYNEDGTEKGPEGKMIALRIREYNEKFAEIHDFDTDMELFENVRAKAHKLYTSVENGEQLYRDWLKRNTVVTTSDEFNDEYNRRRKEKMIIKFAYNTGNDEILDWMEDFDTEYIPHKEWQQAFDKKLEELDIQDQWSQYYNEEEIDARIRDILKPYRVGLEVDVELMGDEALKELRELEREKMRMINEQFLTQKAANKGKKTKYDFTKYKQTLEKYNNMYNDLVDFITTYEYDQRLSAEQSKIYAYNKEHGTKLKVENTDWFKNNHVYWGDDKETGQPIYKPTRAWTKLIPKGAFLDEGNLVDVSEEKEGSRLAKYVTTVPNSKYRSVKLHDNMLIDKDQGIKDGIFDDKGFPLPKMDTEAQIKKWSNPKYEKIQKDERLKNFFKVLTTEYKAAQQLLPANQRLGNTIPFIQKGVAQTLFASDGTKISDKLSAAKELIGEKFTIDKAVDVEYENSNLNSIDGKYIPVQYSTFIESDKVDKDVLSSIMKYIFSAQRYRAAEDISSDARTLVALIDKREADPEGGAVKRVLGKSKQDSNYRGEDTPLSMFVRETGESRAAQLLKDFVEMQIFGEMTKPTEFELAGNILSADKIAGIITSFQSRTQIGGLSPLGFIKGAANALNAQAMQFIEAHAGEFYSKKA